MSPAAGFSLRCRLLEPVCSHVKLRFEVSDSGIGLEPVVLSYSLNAFAQADNSLAVAGKSTSNFDPVLPGVDLDVALSMMRGNRVRLFRLLRMFAVGHGKDAVQIRQALASNDPGSAERMAHSLKGAAGMLGIRRVYELASELNILLRVGAPADVVENLLTLLETEMADVCTGIELQLTI